MSNINPLNYIHDRWRRLSPYEAVDPPEKLAEAAGIQENEVIKLNANENPYGPSPLVLEALRDLPNVHIYPDPAQVAMRKAIGDYIKVDPHNVVVGNGSDEIIDLVFRAVLSDGDAIINAVPTFGMYPVTAQICGANTISVPRGSSFEIPVHQVMACASKAKIIVVVSPNNPTGNLTPLADIEVLLDSGSLLVLDEAYAEFSNQTAMGLINKYPNLIILRTLSKWGGLAGLRVGYGVMNTALADVLMRGKPPYNVSRTAEIALLASLKDHAVLDSRAQVIIAERDRLYETLENLPGVDPLPSQANFILCHIAEGRAKMVYEGLAQKGIAVRYYSEGRLENYLRISVGTTEQTNNLIVALKTLV